jgi:uncharacterized membrane-anchored protein YitT (DUF2179 family)
MMHVISVLHDSATSQIQVRIKGNNMDDLKNMAWNLLLISIGSLLCAIAINGILVPKQTLAGSITGVALLINFLIPKLSVGALYFIINIPIYVFGWKFVGRRFFWYSLAGLIIFSGLVTVVEIRLPLEDLFLSVLLAGILSGIGAGIILRSRGSVGGLDILAIILLKKFSIRLGSTILGFNAVFLTVAAFLFTIDAALYALIFIFVSSRLVDLVVTGLSQRKQVMIISLKWSDIERGILERLNRGCTLVQAEGGFSGEKQMILYSVITIFELPKLKSMIREIDSGAFVVVTDTMEVIGQRIGNQPHW